MELRVLNKKDIKAAWLKACQDNTELKELNYPDALLKAQFQADIKAFVEWGNSECPHCPQGDRSEASKAIMVCNPRYECGVCWESLKQLVEE